MNWYVTLGTLLMTAGAVAGCSPAAEPPLGSARGALEHAGLSTIATLASALHTEHTAQARKQAIVSLATGAVFAPYSDSAGLLRTSSNGTTIRGTCGITFVSPSYGVTAAHCVDANSGSSTNFDVEMYRPHPILQQAVPQTTSLSGVFPNYLHGNLSERDGYFTETFHCTLAARCSDDFGGWLNCAHDLVHLNQADLALVHCSDRPGEKYGYATIALEDSMAAPVFMPWKHEIYDAPLDILDDRFQHYSRLTELVEDNYHYFGLSTTGQQANQLQSLISIPFADGSEHRKLSTADAGVLTDLLGCHGSSGSGVFQTNSRGDYELLGPAVLGNHELNSYLCNHIPAYDAFSRDPGCFGLTYARLASTREMLRQWASTLLNDCNDRAEPLADVLHSPACGVSNTVPAATTATVDAAHPLTLEVDPLTVGVAYRVVLQASLTAACTEACPTLFLQYGDQQLVRQKWSTGPGFAKMLGVIFRATSTDASLELHVEGDGEAQIDQAEVVLETQPIRFDLAEERERVTLVDLDSPGGVPMPARYVGALDGFKVSLAARERLAINRLALVREATYLVRFAAHDSSQLRCGFLDEDGQPVASADCSSGSATLSAQSPTSANWVSFYVENTAANGDVELEEIALASSPLPASDADAIPDWGDACPNRLVANAYDALNARHDVVVSSEPNQRCCRPGAVLREGTAAADAFDDSKMPELCAFLRTGSDILFSGDADDFISADEGNDYVSAGSNADEVLGGGGNDVLLADGDGAVLFGGDGDDSLFAERSPSATLYGGSGRDILVGGAGNDMIIPGSGGDWVYAGAGDDEIRFYARCELSAAIVIHGGGGVDTLISPLTEAQWQTLGIAIDGVERFVIDTEHAIWSDCYIPEEGS